jgi:periplasmic copper chaperone A
MTKALLLSGFFLLAVTAISNANAATEIAANVIKVETPEVRMAASNPTAAESFMTLENTGNEKHELVGAAAQIDATTLLHKDVIINGQTTMVPIKEITVPAKSDTELSYSSLHVMLIGLKQPLQNNSIVPIKLKFDDGSELTINAKAVS